MRESYPATISESVLAVRRPETEWLSTGWNGGRRRADCAYNVSVPEGWDCTDLASYARERLERAGFAEEGPTLLTGVDLEHARGARCGPVTVYATAGVSNPAALPAEPSGGELPEPSAAPSGVDAEPERANAKATKAETGTVNLLVCTTRALAPGALANLLTVAAEAKAATLLERTGFPGTTTDAVVVGHDPAGETAPFSGSATAVGAATRACVREAVTASLRSRYDGTDAALPASVADAEYGTSTTVEATVFRPR